MSILTKALIFKPKKLKDGWEHKKGFYVSIDAKSAFSMINNARNKRQYSTSNRPNYNKQLSLEELRALAEIRLYEIESSSNNYIEFICAVGGLVVFIYLVTYLTIIWDYPSQDSVRIFLILAALFGFLIFLFFKKEKAVSYLVEDFLDIENALYHLEYGESQHQSRK